MFGRKMTAVVALAAFIAIGAPALLTGRAAPAQADTVAAVADLLNAERTRRGLQPLQSDASLNRAAAGHARDMAKRGYFNHRSQDGRTFSDRIKAAGYCRAAMAENIALGQNSVAKAISSWMDSPPHRKNMMNRRYSRFGIGKSNTYWVLTLAGPCT
ncbi:CAP domain-containing protein [Thalassovita sp.]|uniref:CAP domain-containing protein n=1 Tax=Thalassovita sp. TaxID=1979401 RepID=UPI002B269A2C|nr:CAP domain-containing protein [Thalassovita sp.]